MLSRSICEVLLHMTLSIYVANKKFMTIPRTNLHHNTREEIMYVNRGHLTMRENFQRVRLKSAGER